MSTTNTSGGHRLLPKAARKHTEPIPEHLLDWMSAFGLLAFDQDDSFRVYRDPYRTSAAPVGAAWGPAADDRDVWFATDWRNPKEAVRVTGGRDGALRHILRGEEIRRAVKAVGLEKVAHVLARHEYDETVFGGFFCSTGCMTRGMEAGDDDLTPWPCKPLLDADLDLIRAERFITELRKTYEIGRWPASRARTEAAR